LVLNKKNNMSKFKTFISNYSISIAACVLTLMLVGVWHIFANPTKTIIGDDVHVIGDLSVVGEAYDSNGNLWGIENGSNSNGNYVKFPDGTMIAWHITPSEFISSYWYWTYPVPFVEIPILTGNPATRRTTSANDVENVHFGVSGVYRADTDGVRVYHQSTRGVAFASTLMAIGRWK
jgi:hypothetical protein